MKRLALLLLLFGLALALFAETEIPPFEVKDHDVGENFRNIYYRTDEVNKNFTTFKTNLTVYNVKDHGAKGNGTDDDTAVIAAGIASGFNVMFPTGTYLTTGGFLIQPSQRVYGMGRNRTTIKRSSGTNPLFLFTGTSGGSLSDMTLDGNSLGGSLVISSATNVSGTSLTSVVLKNVGGTSYAFQLINNSFYGNYEDLEFRNNYGNIYLDGVYYSSFHRTRMFGSQTGYGILFSTALGGGQTDLNFYDTYMESFINMTLFGVRDIRFIGMRVRLDSMTDAWFQARNTVGGGGPEVAQVTLQNCAILKAVANSTYPLFDINLYQFDTQNVHIYDAVSASTWSVVRDRGTNDFRMINWEVESSNYWILFDTNSTGGFNTEARHVNYTQGVQGGARWSNAKPNNGSRSSYITVTHSNLSHSIAPSVGSGFASGYRFEHIDGDLDLTNALGPVLLWNMNPAETLTDPDKVLVGAEISSSITTSANFTASSTFIDACSIQLDTGTYSIGGQIWANSNGATWTTVYVGISTQAGNTAAGMTTGDTRLNSDWASSSTTPLQHSMTILPYDITVAEDNKPYYLKVNSIYTAGTPQYRGRLAAVRKFR